LPWKKLATRARAYNRPLASSLESLPFSSSAAAAAELPEYSPVQELKTRRDWINQPGNAVVSLMVRFDLLHD